MTMENLDAVRERYGFDEWKGSNALDREIELHDLTIARDLFPSAADPRVRRIDVGDGTVLLRMELPSPGDEEALLLVDIRECPSREKAHEVLLELLANMQAPDVYRLPPEAPGDVAFARDPDVAVIFARGNLAVSIANGGARIVPVAPIAQQLDAWLVAGAGSPSPPRPAAA